VPVVADDERADRPVRYVGVGLLSLLAIAAAMALLFLPPAFAAGFILRGRPVLRWIGYGLFAAWLGGLTLAGRRLMSARSRRE
jgi:hypothetical protein